jgi:hypothetical protein
VENVQAAPSPASLSSAEIAAARKRLLEELAVLDAIEPDPSDAQADCRSGAGPHAGEDDRPATAAAERAENAPASPAVGLKSEAEETQAFREIRKSPEPIDVEFTEVGAGPAAGLGSNLFGEPEKPKKITQAEIDAAFAEFWRAYPRRVGKQDAAKAFAAIAKKGVDLGHVVAAAGRYSDATKAARTEPHFVKHPGGWLRDGRYDDGADALPQAKSSPAPRGGYERGRTSIENFERAKARILAQAEAVEKAKRDEELARAEAYRNAQSPF